MEKAKTHYDAKKQQNQELQEQLRGLEQLQTENKELRAEADRLGRELQQAGPPPHGPGAQPGGTGEALATPAHWPPVPCSLQPPC